MGRTHAELLDSISASELTAWGAFERVHGPIGAVRGDIHTALIMSVLINANRGKDSKPISPADLLPLFGHEPPEEMSTDQMVATAELITDTNRTVREG